MNIRFTGPSSHALLQSSPRTEADANIDASTSQDRSEAEYDGFRVVRGVLIGSLFGAAFWAVVTALILL